MSQRVIENKKPKNKHWKYLGKFPIVGAFPADIYLHSSGLKVLSNIEAPEPETIGPEYHISVTMNGRRCTSNEAKIALKAFDMEHADEDNHTSVARHFWQPVADSKADYVCPCKEKEPAIKLDKGDFIYRPLER